MAAAIATPAVTTAAEQPPHDARPPPALLVLGGGGSGSVTTGALVDYPPTLSPVSPMLHNPSPSMGLSQQQQPSRHRHLHHNYPHHHYHPTTPSTPNGHSLTAKDMAFIEHRRRTHNAAERVRRDNLNAQYLDLAAIVPTLATAKRPSKSAIVSGSVEYVESLKHSMREKDLVLQRALRTHDALLQEVNRLRSALGMDPVDPPPDIDTDPTVIGTAAGLFENPESYNTSFGLPPHRASGDSSLSPRSSSGGSPSTTPPIDDSAARAWADLFPSAHTAALDDVTLSQIAAAAAASFATSHAASSTVPMQQDLSPATDAAADALRISANFEPSAPGSAAVLHTGAHGVFPMFGVPASV